MNGIKYKLYKCINATALSNNVTLQSEHHFSVKSNDTFILINFFIHHFDIKIIVKMCRCNNTILFPSAGFSHSLPRRHLHRHWSSRDRIRTCDMFLGGLGEFKRSALRSV